MLHRAYNPMSISFAEALGGTAVVLLDKGKRVPRWTRFQPNAADALLLGPVWTYPRDDYTQSLIIQPSKKTFKESRDLLFSTANQAVKASKARKVNELDFYPGKLKQDALELWLNTAILSNYTYSRKSDPVQEDGNEKEEENYEQIEKINVVDYQVDDEVSMQRMISSAHCALFSRELANTRGSDATTTYMAEQAQKIADNCPDASITIIRGDDLLGQDMRMLYAVGKAASNPPQLVHLKYRGGSTDSRPIAIVGKGVTFDTGGVNLKPTGFIEDQYMDKSGSCITLSLFKWVTENKIPINIDCVLALAENAIDSRSFLPGDILQSKKGITVEIGNTDAEGRLCLADAMTYIQQAENPQTLIDIATLTGSVKVALGTSCTGIFGNEKTLISDIRKAGKYFKEPSWHLPILADHKKAIKGRFADITNSAKGRYGGASQAAAFLQNFVEKDVNWAHLDIAGSGKAAAASTHYSAGSTGIPLQTLVKYITTLTQEK